MWPKLKNKYICLKSYNAIFPKDNPNYPCKKIDSYLHVEKQCGNNLWVANYWNFADNKSKINLVYFTGFIKEDGTIKLVESDPVPAPVPDGISTGILELKPLCKNKYQVYYLGVSKGISFTTIALIKNKK